MDRFSIALGKEPPETFVDQKIKEAWYAATDVLWNDAGVNILDWLKSWDDQSARIEVRKQKGKSWTDTV